MRAPARIGDVQVGDGRLVVIAGPCVIESQDHTLRLAKALRDICARLECPFVFKASYDKANRSSVGSFRGPGMDDGLKILGQVRSELGVPVISDVHTPDEAAPASETLDALQIPAFLCRQTDLIAAAACTGRTVNIKKGQFMSPEEMGNVVDKARSAGTADVLLTERGTFFGYHRLVNDMTALPKMQAHAPVVFDATHSCQFPGGQGTMSGGQRQFTPHLARAAVAAGADALFLEVHDCPDEARSDPATVWPLDQFSELLDSCRRVYAAVAR
jgi:2-dehydro-3-deoxyphosphooctonate aldolase (KDO 8-P synthase)